MSTTDHSDVVVQVISGSYAPSLLLLSLIIAILSSCIAAVITIKAQANSSGPWKRNLLLGSGIIQGLGIWAMHVIGMYAFQLPVAIEHNLSIVLIALIPALLAGLAIAYIGHNKQTTLGHLLFKAALINIAMILLHFSSMTEMHTAAEMHHDIITLAWAFALSYCLTLLAIRLNLNAIDRLSRQPSAPLHLFAAGAAMALAIISSFYAYMSGTVFFISGTTTTATATATAEIISHQHQNEIAWLIGAALIIISGILLLMMRFNHRLAIASKVEEHDRYLSGIIDNTAEGIIVIDKDSLIETFNPAAEHIFGYSASEAIGQNVSLLLPEHERQEHQQYTKKSTLHSSRIINRGRDLEGRRKDGSLFPLELNVSPLNIKGRKGFIGITRDITQRKQAALEQIKSNERLNFLLKTSPIVIYTCKAEGDFGATYISPNVKDIFGYRPEDFTENSEFWMSNIHPEDKAAVLDKLGILFEQGTHSHEYRFKINDGSYCWVHDDLRLVRNKQGEAIEIVGSWSDIDDKKYTEIALQNNEERFRRSQVFANIGTWDWNIQSGNLYWSERIAPLFGYEEGKLETTYENFITTIHPDDRQNVIDAVNNCIENNTDYDIEHRTVWPDGQIHWVHERGDVTRADDGTPLHMLGVVIDITNSKHLEETLNNQQLLLNLLRQGMIDYVGEGEFSGMADKLLLGLLELTASEYGFTGEICYNDDGSSYLKTHAISNIAWNEETRRFYEDNAPNGMEFKNIDTLFGAVLKTGKVVIANDAPHDSRRGGLPEGHPPLNAFLGAPIYYGDEMIGMYGLANRAGGYTNELIGFLRPFDITYGVIIHALRMAKTEQQNLFDLKQATYEAQKANLAKSEFLSRMSHELRTPMNAILGFTQILQLDSEELLTEGHQDSLQEIMHAGKHLLELINDVLDLAHIESGHMEISIEPVSIIEILNSCKMLMAPLANERKIHIDFPRTEKALALADQTKLKQVMINLISNAIKYGHEDGHIKVQIKHNNDRIKISVSDNGQGIPEHKQQEIFTAFNRLGAENTTTEGSGIGLVITRNLIHKMNGDIGFHSSLDQGSTFWIELPLFNADILPASRKSHDELLINMPPPAEEAPFHILYIEDNNVNIKLVQKALSRQDNITMDTADSAERGLTLLNKKPFDLILLDINLPGMSGYDFLKIVRNHPINQSLLIFGLSANAMPRDIERAKKAGFDRYITKPIDLDFLIVQINALRLEYNRPERKARHQRP